jgi:hypothetical protein
MQDGRWGLVGDIVGMYDVRFGAWPRSMRVESLMDFDISSKERRRFPNLQSYFDGEFGEEDEC